MNCWEFKKCGKANNGQDSCPAYPDHGDMCARVAGTFCAGEAQGEFASKPLSCIQCDYYRSEHYSRMYSTVG